MSRSLPCPACPTSGSKIEHLAVYPAQDLRQERNPLVAVAAVVVVVVVAAAAAGMVVVVIVIVVVVLLVVVVVFVCTVVVLGVVCVREFGWICDCSGDAGYSMV